MVAGLFKGESSGLEVLSLIRILRIARLVRVMARMAKFSKITDVLLGSLRYTRWGLVLRVWKVLMFVITLLHFVSCYWLFVVYQMEDPFAPNSWLRMQHDVDLVEKFSGKNRGFLHLYF